MSKSRNLRKLVSLSQELVDRIEKFRRSPEMTASTVCSSCGQQIGTMRDGLPSESDTLLVLIRSGLEFRERLKS